MLLLLTLSQFASRIRWVYFCCGGIRGSYAFEMDVISNCDVIALPLEGFQLLPAQTFPALLHLTSLSLLLSSAFAVLPLQQLSRDVETAQHISRHITDVRVCTAYVFAQHPVIILIHLKTRTHCRLSRRCRSLPGLIPDTSLISLLRPLGRALRCSLGFLSGVVVGVR